MCTVEPCKARSWLWYAQAAINMVPHKVKTASTIKSHSRPQESNTTSRQEGIIAECKDDSMLINSLI